MADEKVTVRFETTNLGSADVSDDILLSGPVEIFAVLDNIYSIENGQQVAHPTLEEFPTSKYETEEWEGLVSLKSPYVDWLVKNAKANEYSEKSIIIYVKDVRDANSVAYNSEDDQTHRGAYFYLKDIFDGELLWQEILLGTHSHTNKEILDNLGNGLAGYKNLSKGMLIMMNPDGTFTFKESSENQLPELPIEIQDRINELKKYESLKVPTESSDNHLDAEHSELQDTYDWQKPFNTAVGNCRDVYLRLIRANKKLYITSDLELSKEDNADKYNVSCGLFIEEVSFEKLDDDSIRQLVSEGGKYYLSFPVENFILNNDDVYLFDDEELVDSRGYKLISYDSDKKEILFRIDKEYFKEKEDLHNLTLLITYNSRNVSGFSTKIKQKFESGEFNLKDINAELIKLYIEGELQRRPSVPHLYLASDEHGNIGWENTLLPSQHFYEKQIVVNQDLLDSAVDGSITFTFEDAYFNATTDFPLLIVDELFAFNDRIIPQLDGSVQYKLPIDSDMRNYKLESGTMITLVIIKNSVGGSLADEIAEKYISKKDAVEILSHGKLSLDDYIKKEDLLGYSKVDHTHSEYALKEHNHDERYANFHHTHPDLYLAIAALIGNGVSASDIDAKVKEYSSEIVKQYEILAEKLSTINDTSVYLSDESIVVINDLIENYNKRCKPSEKISLLDSLLKKPTVKDGLQRLALILTRDTITDTKVLLEKPIAVRLLKGESIGGIKDNKVYDAGTSLDKILSDILNPYYSIDDVRKFLTPNKQYTTLSWYIKDSTDEYKLIKDIQNIKMLGYSGELFFKVNVKNFRDEVCEMTYTNQNNVLDVEKTLIIVDDCDLNQDGYYLYGNVDLSQPLNKRIVIRWRSNLDNDIIYDNYGETPAINNTLNLSGSVYDSEAYPLEYIPDTDFKFVLNKPDIYYIVDNGQKPIEDYIEDELKGLYIDEGKCEFTVIPTEVNNRIILFVEDSINNIRLIDRNSSENVFHYYSKYINENLKLKNYTPYYFEVYFFNEESLEINYLVEEV